MNIPNLAFYIGKSSNRNVVIYSFNLEPDSIDPSELNINMFNPLDVYWLMREQDSAPREELNSFEKRVAYSYETLDSDHDHDSDHYQILDHDSDLSLTITALPKSIINIRKINSRYRCIIEVPPTTLGGGYTEGILKKIKLNLSGFLEQTVDSMDIIYEDLVTQKLHTYTRVP